MNYSFTRAQVFGLLLGGISIGINAAVVMLFISRQRVSGAVAASLTVLMMVVAIVALLRIGREAGERGLTTRDTRTRA